ncbi:MAG: hypothetical protein PPP58_06820 [Natronomonas sp.]
MDRVNDTQPTPAGEQPPVRCDACRAALRTPDRTAMSFLLAGRLTIPVVGCEDHLEQFREVCGFATDGTVELLDHRPAGGITCPGCRLAPHNLHHPVVSLGGGAVTVLACPTHRTAVLERFQTGLQTHQQLTTSLDSL